MIRVTIPGVLAALLLAATSSQAGQSDLPADYDGPPIPVAPEVITRDATGARATIRAVRLTSPLKIDGRLEEEVYQTVKPISDFIQQEPVEGAPATEKTDVWLFFDNDNFYVMARCWDTHPEREIATEMRRDGGRVPRNEDLAFGLDSLYDHRNGYNFELTPAGGVLDGQITNDGAFDASWNGVWQHSAARCRPAPITIGAR